MVALAQDFVWQRTDKPVLKTDKAISTLLTMGMIMSAPTVSPLPLKAEPIYKISAGTYRGGLNFTDEFPGNAPVQTLNPLASLDPVAISADRPTTEAEKIVGQFRRWASLGTDWDGEGAEAPISSSLESASTFVSLLPDSISKPEPMLNATGRAGLFWDLAGLYADLEFAPDNKIVYYIEKNGDKHKGVVAFNTEEMPAVFSALLDIS